MPHHYADPFGGYQASLARYKALPTENQPDPVTTLLGRIEPALVLGSALAGSVPAGLAGLGHLVAGRDSQAAADTVRDVSQALTYQPRTEAGQAGTQTLLDTLAPLAVPAEAIGQTTLDLTGSPAAATGAEIVLDPLNLLPGTKTLGLAATMLPAVRTGRRLLSQGDDTVARAVQLAESLEAAGKAPDEIWSATGDLFAREGRPWVAVERGADGQWRVEVSDAAAELKPDLPAGETLQLADVMTHPDLYRADPESAARNVELANVMPANVRASYQPGENLISINAMATPEQQLSSILHENTHGIQDAARLSPGSNPSLNVWASERMRPVLLAETDRIAAELRTPLSLEQYAKQAWSSDTVTPEIRADYDNYVKSVADRDVFRLAQEAAPLQVYKRAAGEAEARNVQRRANLDPTGARMFSPQATEDVPRLDQVIIPPRR